MWPHRMSFFPSGFGGNQLPPPVVAEMRAAAVRYITCGAAQTGAESVSWGPGRSEPERRTGGVKAAMFTPVDREAIVFRKPHNAFGTPRRAGLNGTAYFGRRTEAMNSPKGAWKI
jgi:hypothetical protein